MKGKGNSPSGRGGIAPFLSIEWVAGRRRAILSPDRTSPGEEAGRHLIVARYERLSVVDGVVGRRSRAWARGVALHCTITRRAVKFNRKAPHWLDVAVYQAQLREALQGRTGRLTSERAAALGEALSRGTERRGEDLVHRATGRRVAALLPVHTLGLPADMDSLTALASEYQR